MPPYVGVDDELTSMQLLDANRSGCRKAGLRMSLPEGTDGGAAGLAGLLHGPVDAGQLLLPEQTIQRDHRPAHRQHKAKSDRAVFWFSRPLNATERKGQSGWWVEGSPGSVGRARRVIAGGTPWEWG